MRFPSASSTTLAGPAIVFCLLLAVPAFAQTSAPADAETYERMLREEKIRHADSTRKLGEEEDRLRAALDAARGRLAEAEARRGSLKKLVAEVEGTAKALQDRIAEGRTVLRAAGKGARPSAVATSEQSRSESVPRLEARGRRLAEVTPPVHEMPIRMIGRP